MITHPSPPLGGLGDHLGRRIAVQGPLTVAEYMAEVLGHPRFGVYACRDPIGAAGDFTTAPEISQMVGELVGLWCAVVWRSMGEPDPVRLVELGPGRGTLMADALRAAREVPAFRAAVRLHLVETSARLRTGQRRVLAECGLQREPAWHESFAGVPGGPLVVVANEFFDALPIRQFQRTRTGWCERLVGTDAGRLQFVLAPSPPIPSIPPIPPIPPNLRGAPIGSVVEARPAAAGIAHDLGRRVSRFGGAALIVDYGHAESAVGDTLQAVRRHRYHDPLDAPGTADLTAHVDFQALARAAADGGARTWGPVPQGRFLEGLGIGARAGALSGDATPGQAADIRAARRRLVDPAEMGTLFKVLAVAHPELPPPPGFE